MVLKKHKKVEETGYTYMSIEDGICYFIYKKKKIIDFTDSEAVIKERLKFVDGIAYPYLVDIRGIGRMTKEARDNYADFGNDLVIASALIVDSAVIRVTANFYIHVNKPKNPTRMFTDKNKALVWLDQFKV